MSRGLKPQLVQCETCKKEILKQVCNLKRTKHNFCSRRCAVSFSNSRKSKREFELDWTLEKYRSKNYSTFRAKVSTLARSMYLKSQKPQFCCECGYSKHFEVAHIKPLKAFPLTATLREVNSLDNLIALCPNCHWEFDHCISHDSSSYG